MKLNQIVEAMFEGENVSPDFSSYESMCAKWRGSKPPPSLAEIEAKRVELLPLEVEAERVKSYRSEGVTIDAMIVALWEKLVENRPEAADALQSKRISVKAKHPKP